MPDRPDQPTVAYVDHLPDLIREEDYDTADSRKRIRLRLAVTERGLEILGDSPYPHLLEELLARLEAAEIEMMLCG